MSVKELVNITEKAAEKAFELQKEMSEYLKLFNVTLH